MENPFSFLLSVVRCDRFVCKLERTQPGAVVGLIGSEHGEEGVQKFPHDSSNAWRRALPSFSRCR